MSFRFPPETVLRWKYPPFEGHFDGQYLWGRGAADDKDHFISMMEAVDHLLSQGFAPKRTIIIGLGFDEEIEGTRGCES
ncbi:carboxypeptidase s [Brettanomyces bruxellensis AWRI1499]|nr:carboxypeptidase s [Brettanomyces bruxellensis AWRI1499]